MSDAFPIIFQWFVLASVVFLAGFICRAIVLSLMKPKADVNPPDSAKPDSGPPFFTLRRPVLWQIIIITAFSRILLYGIAYLSAKFILKQSGGFFDTLPGLWQRSDAPHYISIAENWYVNTGEDRVFLVFLPFYPMLIKAFSFVFGNAVFSGIATSLLSYIAACVLIYEVSLLLGQDEETAFAAVKYAVFFPASFFVNGAFSEGLFLLLSALFFHMLLRKKWAAAACFGMLAAFTRYYGLLLAVPYAVEYAQDVSAALALRRKKIAPRAVLAKAAPVLLIPTGTGLFLLVNYIVSGNFFQFLIYQRVHWSQKFTFFFDNMRDLALNSLRYDRDVSATMFIPELICIVLFICLMFYGAATGFRVSMLAYLGVYFLLSVSAYWMLSFPRYVFGAVPVFPLLASLGRRNRAADTIVSLVCIAGLIYLTVAYVNGFNVF